MSSAVDPTFEAVYAGADMIVVCADDSAPLIDSVERLDVRLSREE
jgi:hypothetical protein